MSPLPLPPRPSVQSQSVRLGIRSKMLALVAFGFLLLLGLQWLLFRELVQPQIESLEKQRVEQQLQHVRLALQASEQDLSSSAADWSAWDILANQLVDPQSRLTLEQLSSDPRVALPRLDISGLVISNAWRVPVLVQGSQAWQPDRWVQSLISGLYAEFSENLKAHKAGLLLSPSGELLQFAAYPVLSSRAEGPSRGVLGMFRRIDPGFLERLQASTELQLQLQLLPLREQAPELWQQVDAAERQVGGLLVQRGADGELAGILLLRDINARPVALVQLDGGPLLLQQGVETLQTFLLLTVLGMLLVLLLVSMTQSRLLSRLLRVTARVREIGRSHNMALRIELPPGHDEIADLADVVNRFLDTREEVALELMASEERFRQLTNTAPVFIWMTNAEGDFTWFNDEMLRFVGLERELFDGLQVFQLVAAEDTAMYEKVARQARNTQQGYQLELRMRRHDGHYRWIFLRTSPMFDADGQLSGYAGIGVDIHERKQMEAKVEFLAHYDALTELPNRTQLTERLSRAIFDAHFSGTQVAVLFLDLDRFKSINDTLGHQVGDWLLQAVSQRLQQTLRGGDMVARLGGDEFVVVLAGLQEQAHMLPLIEKIQQALSQPYFLAGHQLQVTPSIGISLYPQDSQSIRDLLRHADTAMYAVKSAGRNGFAFYDPSMDALTKERLQLESTIRQGLDQQGFFLVYQPQVYGETGQLFGLEALVRLNGSDGLVPPDIFIPVAEETGQILELGEWVLREACRQARAWMDQGLAPVVMAVNISAVQLQRQDVVTLVRQILADTGLPARYLELEITERVIMGNSEELIDTLNALRDLGVRLALDDFGTGYSSLSYLKAFPFDVLKIDQSFVRGITSNPDDVAITEAIIALGTRLKLEVLAEGVESNEHVELLLARGCSHMQGYHFAPPMKADQLAEWLAG